MTFYQLHHIKHDKCRQYKAVILIYYQDTSNAIPSENMMYRYKASKESPIIYITDIEK